MQSDNTMDTASLSDHSDAREPPRKKVIIEAHQQSGGRRRTTSLRSISVSSSVSSMDGSDEEHPEEEQQQQRQQGQEQESLIRKRSDGKRHVSKGTLKLEDLIEAKQRSKMASKTKEEVTEEDKKEERRAANRLSAFQSRQRRKMIIEDLKKTVAQLSRDNADHQRTIGEMKTNLDKANQEIESLRAQLALHNSRPKHNGHATKVGSSQEQQHSSSPSKHGSTAVVPVSEAMQLLAEASTQVAASGGAASVRSSPSQPTSAAAAAASMQIKAPPMFHALLGNGPTAITPSVTHGAAATIASLARSSLSQPTPAAAAAAASMQIKAPPTLHTLLGNGPTAITPSLTHGAAATIASLAPHTATNTNPTTASNSAAAVSSGLLLGTDTSRLISNLTSSRNNDPAATLQILHEWMAFQRQSKEMQLLYPANGLTSAGGSKADAGISAVTATSLRGFPSSIVDAVPTGTAPVTSTAATSSSAATTSSTATNTSTTGNAHATILQQLQANHQAASLQQLQRELQLIEGYKNGLNGKTSF